MFDFEVSWKTFLQSESYSLCVESFRFLPRLRYANASLHKLALESRPEISSTSTLLQSAAYFKASCENLCCFAAGCVLIYKFKSLFVVDAFEFEMRFVGEGARVSWALWPSRTILAIGDLLR